MCGIFGVINTHPQKINKVMLCTLGINNDSRGGDSCGLFVDGAVEYGFDETKLFQAFMLKSKLLKNLDKAQIVLGHCRKASVGGVTLDKAQPVVHYNDKHEIDFVLIHNGTIRNYTELAAKYIPDVNVAGMSDSQVMMHIFYNGEFDALGEYDGGSVFLMVDYRKVKPEVYIFQGSSLERHTSVKPTAERPFCFIKNKNNIIFSSIPTYLMLYSEKEDYVYYTLPTNKLLTLGEDNQLFSIKAYDRSALIQDPYKGPQINPTVGKSFTTPITTSKAKHLGTLVQGKLDVLFDNTSSLKDLGVVYFDKKKAAYCRVDNPVHGLYNLNFTGAISGTDNFPFYFFNGQLLYNAECFSFLSRMATESKLSTEEFYEKYKIQINYLSPYPFQLDKELQTLFKSTTGTSCSRFNGILERVFTIYSENYTEGSLTFPLLFKGFNKTFGGFKNIKAPEFDFKTLEQRFTNDARNL